MRRRSSSLFGLGCGCKESVSVSASETSDKPAVTPRRVRDPSSADTLTLTSPSSSSCWDDEEEEGEKPESSASTPGFSELLRQLGELEQNVKAWGRSPPPPPPPPPPPGQNREEAKTRWPPHRRSGSEGGRRRIEESVAVVKESADPLGDFRMSMLQMIVEKEIVNGDELRELLHRLLSLNSTHHHDLILQAFAEIWAEVFSGCENTNSSSFIWYTQDASMAMKTNEFQGKRTRNGIGLGTKMEEKKKILWTISTKKKGRRMARGRSRGGQSRSRRGGHRPGRGATRGRAGGRRMRGSGRRWRRDPTTRAGPAG